MKATLTSNFEKFWNWIYRVEQRILIRRNLIRALLLLKTRIVAMMRVLKAILKQPQSLINPTSMTLKVMNKKLRKRLRRIPMKMAKRKRKAKKAQPSELVKRNQGVERLRKRNSKKMTKTDLMKWKRPLRPPMLLI